MTKHTPGPWKWSNWYGPKGKEKRNLQPPPNHGTILVAVEMQINGSAYKMSEANARLIAAAPELLEALEEIVTELHGAIYNRALSTWATKEVAYKHADGLVEKYRALIAKAKGEA